MAVLELIVTEITLFIRLALAGESSEERSG